MITKTWQMIHLLSMMISLLLLLYADCYGLQELEGMLDDDQDMADMYLGRRQEAESKTLPDQSAREDIEPPSPSHSAESMDSLEPSDFLGQLDSESEAEAPDRPRRRSNHRDSHFIKKTSPAKQAQPPPQVIVAFVFDQCAILCHALLQIELLNAQTCAHHKMACWFLHVSR